MLDGGTVEAPFCVDTAGLQFGNRNPVCGWYDMEEELGYTVERGYQPGGCLSDIINWQHKLPGDRSLRRLEIRKLKDALMSQFQETNLDHILFSLALEPGPPDSVIVQPLIDHIDELVKRSALELEELHQSLTMADNTEPTPAEEAGETSASWTPADEPETINPPLLDLDGAESRDTFMQ
jgi:hypothetical protein